MEKPTKKSCSRRRTKKQLILALLLLSSFMFAALLKRGIMDTIIAIKDIKEGMHDIIIRVRVIRSWSARGSRSKNILSVNCIMVDENGDAIHATADGQLNNYFQSLIKIGVVYDVTKFLADHNKDNYRVIQHSCIIRMAKATKFEQHADQNIMITRYRFYFASTDELQQRNGDTFLLTEYIGRIHTVEEIQHGPDNSRRRTFYIHDINDKTVAVTFWGDLALDFNQSMLQRFQQPLIVILTGMIVKSFYGRTALSSTSDTTYELNSTNPYVQELQNRFKDYPQIDFVEVHKAYRQEHADDSTTLVTITFLLNMPQTENMNAKYKVRGKIVNIDIAQGWFYEACPEKDCFRAVRKLNTIYWCADHATITNLPTMRNTSEEASSTSAFTQENPPIQSEDNVPLSVLTKEQEKRRRAQSPITRVQQASSNESKNKKKRTM